MSDKIPLPFQNNKNIVSQAPNTKSRTENKSVISSNMIREKNTLSLAISMNIFPTGLHYLQRKKKTIQSEQSPKVTSIYIYTNTPDIYSFREKFYLPSINIQLTEEKIFNHRTTMEKDVQQISVTLSKSKTSKMTTKKRDRGLQGERKKLLRYYIRFWSISISYEENGKHTFRAQKDSFAVSLISIILFRTSPGK